MSQAKATPLNSNGTQVVSVSQSGLVFISETAIYEEHYYVPPISLSLPVNSAKKLRDFLLEEFPLEGDSK